MARPVKSGNGLANFAGKFLQRDSSCGWVAAHRQVIWLCCPSADRSDLLRHGECASFDDVSAVRHKTIRIRARGIRAVIQAVVSGGLIDNGLQAGLVD